MEKVAGCPVSGASATLTGFFRSKVHKEEYPGVTRNPECKVQGVLYSNLDKAALDRLDQFEGEYYQRDEVTVVLDDGPQERTAMVYVIKEKYQHLLTGEEWRFEDFLAGGKSAFQQNYLGFNKI